MFGNINDKNVVEQTFENEKDSVSEISVEDTPATSNSNPEQNRDYLNSSLFSDVKTISIEELDSDKALRENKNKVEEVYANTFGDISENTLVEGRVVGMNDRDVLIDIGFKSEGIIDRSEFDKNDLPKLVVIFQFLASSFTS